MGTELIKARAFYAVDSIKESGVLVFEQFFPLLIGWAVSQLLPAVVFFACAGIGAIMDFMILHVKTPSIFTGIGSIVGGLLFCTFYAGWNMFTLRVARRLPIKTSDVFRPLPQVVSCGVVLVLTSLAMLLVSWLVIAAPLLFLKWQLAPYYVLDRGYGPIQAMRQSWHDTNRVFIPLAIADVVIWGVGALLGATVFVPILCFMLSGVLSAMVYNKWLTDEDNPEFRQLSNSDYVN